MNRPLPRSLPDGVRAPAAHVDAVPLFVGSHADPLRRGLDDLLTRSFYSAAGYVFEADPWVVAEDDEVLQAVARIREQDRRHAYVLGTMVQSLGGVPQPGVFPWWNLDLNYLTVPTLARFVVEALEEEIGLYARLGEAWPETDRGGRAALHAIREEKGRQVAELGPLVEAALAREAAAYRAGSEQVRKVRLAREAKAKAAAAAARKAKAAAGKAPAAAAPKAAAPAAPAPKLLDPNEPGLAPKEKARRQILRIRAASGAPAGGASAPAVPASAPAAPAPAADLPDPNEPGIAPKEKARRQMLRVRAAAAASAGGAPAPSAAPPAAAPSPGADLPDPNEAGIAPKEKARRQMLRMRAAAAPAAAAPAAASPAPPTPPPAAAAAAAPAELLDPDEPGLSPKEKARRQVLKARAAAGTPSPGATSPPAAAPAAAATPAPTPAAAPAAAPAEDAGDPDEPGLSPKEKARRQVLRMRAQRGAG